MAFATEVTSTFVASNYDGYLYTQSIGLPYSTKHDALVADGSEGSNIILLGGQKYYNIGTDVFELYRAALFFDTSGLPDGATIINANLSLYITTDYSDNDFNLTVQSTDVFPHNPLQLSDWYYGYYTTSGGSRNTSSIGGVGYWNITLSSTGRNYISTTTTTRLMLRSSNDINNIAPTGSEYLEVASRDGGEATAAKLYVTYIIGTTTSSSVITTTITSGGTTTTATTTSATTSLGSGASYLIHGPYYEDGTVADAVANLYLYQPYNTTVNFILNGTDAVADDYSVLLSQPGTYLAWNISSSTDNTTRTYAFLPTLTFEEIWIFIPRTTEPTYPYTFVPADFYGMRSPYLETQININGATRTVERKKADVNQISFFMIQWHKYDLTWRCDQGVYTQSFNAENTFTTSLVILSGAFPTTTSTMPSASAGRLNTTCITASYVDSMGGTYWLYMNITHLASSGGTQLDYDVNVSTSSYSLTWNLADNETDYIVHIEAYAYSGYFSWKFSCPAQPASNNPFAGLFNFMGNWGIINPSQLPAGLIIVLFLAIGSTRSTGASCVLAWVVGAILMVMGWFTVSLPLLAFAGITSIFIYIAEQKETAREV